jgi:hypothetical protein
MRPAAYGLCIIAIIFTIVAARADEPQEITFYLPGLVESTAPTDLGAVELQMGAGYASLRNGRGTPWTLAPEIDIGVAPNLEISASGGYVLGDTSSANSGSGSLGLLYQFSKPAAGVPGFAVDADYSASYGVGPEVGQTTLRGVVTQWLGRTDKSPRLDLNLSWYHLTNAGMDNRPNRYDIGVAATQELRSDLALVIELYHTQRQERGEVETIVDIGLLHQIGDYWELGASVGAGIGRYSPKVQILVGVLRSLKLF